MGNLAGRVGVDGDDARRAGHHRADDHRQTDAAEAEDGDCRPRLDLGGVAHGTDARGYAATQQADLLQRRVAGDLRQRYLRQHGVLGEGRGPHVVKYRLAVPRKAAAAIGHQPPALRRANRLAEVRLARAAELALSALRSVQGNHMVTDGHRADARPDRLDDAAPLVTEDAREDAFGIGSGEREGIGVADAGGDDAHQHLALPWLLDIHLGDLQGLPGSPGNRSA